MSAPPASRQRSAPEAAAATIAGVAGRALGAAFATLAVVRRPHPVHLHGVVLHGEIRRIGSPIRTGLAWIDEAAAPLPVIARASRSVSLPAPLPDVIGLALRFDGPEGSADLELASTGVGWPWRFVLRAHRSPSRAHLHAILPYRSPTGPVLLGAGTIAPGDLPPYPDALADRLAAEPWRLELLVARPRGAWRQFGELELRRRPGPLDPLLRFDAGRRLLPGAREYAWAHRLRQPAYDRVQAE